MSTQRWSTLDGEGQLEEPSAEASPENDCASGVHSVARRARPSNDQRTRSGWAVVEQFVKDGFVYRLVRRPMERDRAARLTKRERQALAYALDGHSNKYIAAMLGVSPSTIGVLLFRAAAKMGVKSRRELLLAYARLKDELKEA